MWHEVPQMLPTAGTCHHLQQTLYLPSQSHQPQGHFGRKMRKTLQKRHSWTDEELNILSYLRHTRHWRFKEIQTSYFPSLSPNALLGAYWRLSTEDRIRRASRIATPIIAPRNTGEDLPGFPKFNPRVPVSHRGQVAIALLLSQKTTLRPWPSPHQALRVKGIHSFPTTAIRVVTNSGQTDPQSFLQGSRNI